MEPPSDIIQALDEALFDLASAPPGRFDCPNPLQLETRGVTAQITLPPRTSIPVGAQAEIWSSNTIHKNSIAAKLRLAGMVEAADKLEHCHSEFTFAVCNDCGRVGKFPNRCDNFYCPECQPRLSHDRRQAVEWWVALIQQPKHVVLTVRNIPDLSKGHVKQLRRWFTQLRRRKFASNWEGGFYAIEVTNEGAGWHLHIHALVNARWIDGPELARQWASITSNAGYIVKVKDAREGDYLKELTKYVAKGSQVAKWSPDQITTFINAFTGVRTFGVFGSLYGARTEFAEWLKAIREAKPRCNCGSCSVTYYTEAQFIMRDLVPDHHAAARPPTYPDPTPTLPDLDDTSARNYSAVAQ